MEPLFLIILALILPIWMTLQEIRARESRNYFGRFGVIVVKPEALEFHSSQIGRYMEHEIWGTLRFHGQYYDFDRIEDPSYKSCVQGGELYLDPGLVYICRRLQGKPRF